MIGFLFGYGVKGAPTQSVFLTRAYVSGKIVVALFSTLVYWSYKLAPDWMFNYFTRDADVPSWIIVYIFLLYFVAYAAGFAMKFETAKIHKAYPILLMVALSAAAIAVPIAMGERYTLVGTMDQFLNHTAVPLSQSHVGKVPGRITLALLPLGIGLLWWSRKERF
ncbi:MAG TPA: hypothetical protein VFX30_10495 [bacterium]|nr:hypothetical protein [bacterium]